MRVLSFVDTATGLCSFAGLRLAVVVGLLGSRIWFCKFLLFLYYSWVAPPVPLLVDLGWSPRPLLGVAHKGFWFSLFWFGFAFWSPFSFFPPPVRA